MRDAAGGAVSALPKIVRQVTADFQLGRTRIDFSDAPNPPALETAAAVAGVETPAIGA